MNQPNNLPAAVASPPPCARDIEALVHERIMGLLPVKVWIATKDGGMHCCLASESMHEIEDFLQHYENGMARGYSLGSWNRYPLYTEDPIASKMLREKMREDGWKSCLFSTDVFTMRYWGYKRGQDTVEAHADTEEMAVALAALRALGVSLQGAPEGATPQAEKK